MSGKVRIYEVAKQLNLNPKQVVGLFQAIGISDVRNHMSSVEPEAIERVKRHLEKQRTHDVVEERVRFGVVKRRAVAKPGSPTPPEPAPAPSLPPSPSLSLPALDELVVVHEQNRRALPEPVAAREGREGIPEPPPRNRVVRRSSRTGRRRERASPRRSPKRSGRVLRRGRKRRSWPSPSPRLRPFPLRRRRRPRQLAARTPDGRYGGGSSARPRRLCRNPQSRRVLRRSPYSSLRRCRRRPLHGDPSRTRTPWFLHDRALRRRPAWNIGRGGQGCPCRLRAPPPRAPLPRSPTCRVAFSTTLAPEPRVVPVRGATCVHRASSPADR